MPGLADLPGDHVASAYVTSSTAAQTFTQGGLFRAPGAVTVTGVYWVPQAAATGDTTNYCSLAVQNKGAAGSGSTVVVPAKAYTFGVDSTANAAETLTLAATAANLNMAAGDCLALVKTVAASGLATGAGYVHVAYKYR